MLCRPSRGCGCGGPPCHALRHSAAARSFPGSALPLIEPDRLKGPPPLLRRDADRLLEAARHGLGEGSRIRAAVAGWLEIDVPSAGAEAIPSRSPRRPCNERGPGHEGERRRAARHRGGVTEEGDRHPVAGQVAVRDQRYDLMPAQGIGHRSPRATYRDEIDPPDPPPRAQELEEGSGSNLLDRGQRMDAVLLHEDAVRLEVAQMGERHYRAAAKDGLPALPVVDAHDAVDPIRAVVRGAQQLQVVARMLDES